MQVKQEKLHQVEDLNIVSKLLLRNYDVIILKLLRNTNKDSDSKFLDRNFRVGPGIYDNYP